MWLIDLIFVNSKYPEEFDQFRIPSSMDATLASQSLRIFEAGRKDNLDVDSDYVLTLLNVLLIYQFLALLNLLS